MEIAIQTTSDIMVVKRAGEDWFSADPSQWETLMEMLKEIDYAFFPSKSEEPPIKS